MTLPRLTEVGDTFTGVVAKCAPVTGADQYEYVQFVFAEGDSLELPRIGVDHALTNAGYTYEGGQVAYDQVPGDALTFSRIKPTRGTRPGWRIEKAVPPVPTVPKLPKIPSPPPKSDPLGDVVTRAELNPSPEPRRPADVEQAAEAKRAMIRAAYARELAFVLGEPFKLAKKAKADFDVNAAVSTILIEQAKRGCL